MPSHAHRRLPPPRLPTAAAAACALALAAGCGRALDTDYATVRGPSINGVSAFIQMLRDAGHDTTATSRLPAAGDGRDDTLVVFAHRFGRLPADALARLGAFLGGGGSRTLLLVLRDDDCAIGYWEALAARDDLDAGRRRRVREELDEARARLAAGRREAEPAAGDDLGFSLETCDRAASPGPLDVEVRSAGGFADGSVAARWNLHRRLVAPPAARVLWRSGADPLLVGERRNDAEILVVASATPLLNGGLVDPGNRRLAADLVARLPRGGRVHVAGSTAVAEAEADADTEPSIWRLLSVAPHPWIAAQVLAAMALFCWWRAPIVGRPRRESPTLAQDFGLHVAALGAHLARTRGDDFATRRIDEWRRLSAAPAVRRRRPAGI